MYDWPETQRATDRWWACLRDEFQSAGMIAPAELERELPEMAVWTAADLLLAQTCGYPYVMQLREQVALLGTPDYGVPNCPAGYYRSAFVVHQDDDRESLAAFTNARFAYNAIDSQSGYQAMTQALRSHGGLAQFFSQQLATGSHRRSIKQLAEGHADIAAIDYVSWRLARNHEPVAGKLRVLCLSDAVPGLPYIAHLSADTQLSIEVIESALARLDEPTRETLSLCGFWRSSPTDYDVIAKQG